MLKYRSQELVIHHFENRMSIMVNSIKKARKGTVVVRLDSGCVKACFPRSYCGEGKQIKLATGINPDDYATMAGKLQRRLQLELEDGKLDDGNGNFNAGRYQEILEEYGLRAKLRLVKNLAVDQPPKPELSILEIWDKYCEYVKPNLKESFFQQFYIGQYLNYIQSAIEATKSEDAVKIRNWLIENRHIETVKKLLSVLNKAYKFSMKSKLIDYNPFDGMFEELKQVGAKGKNQDEINLESDDDLLDKSKAYSWDEVEIILDYIKNNPNINHWFKFVKFKFLTGCRTGEAIALMWGDIFWDKEQIAIRRNYGRYIKKFLTTKNETARFFPMPKNSELWELLKSIPEGENNDIVFKSKNNQVIKDNSFFSTWRGTMDGKRLGIIRTLIKQGKLTKYLPPYNTRHTFITHQIFDLGRDEKIVNAWCEHSGEVSQKHYQDIGDRAIKINPDLPANQQGKQQSEIDLLKEQLKQQQELINKLLADKQQN